MRAGLPHIFLGYPAGFADVPGEPRSQVPQPSLDGPVTHRVFPVTVRGFFQDYLAYDIHQPLSAADWLTFPSQSLLSITAGAVYHDGVGDLTEVRERFSYYPHDVWLYLLASGWQRISQEEHLMPRAGYVGDELGSALLGSRLVRDIISLCFLMERRYAPYPKWFGSAFKQLACADSLLPALWKGQRAETWQDRESALCEAFETLARMHNSLDLTEKMSESVSRFHDRPFKVINGERFAHALCARITGPDVKRIASRPLIGGIDQFSDSTDLRSDPSWRGALKKLYE
jgi:hypothetical protein